MNCPHCNQPINLGRELGKLKSEAKAKASRENGRKGGRPKLDRPSCECGSEHARWRGPSNGLRQYYCDECYCQFHDSFFVQSSQVRGEPRQYWVVERAKIGPHNRGMVSDCLSKAQAYRMCADLNEHIALTEPN